MNEKFYPVILVAMTGAKLRLKLVYSPDEHSTFCARHVKPGTSLKEIKTLEALYLEKTATLVFGK